MVSGSNALFGVSCFASCLTSCLVSFWMLAKRLLNSSSNFGWWFSRWSHLAELNLQDRPAIEMQSAQHTQSPRETVECGSDEGVEYGELFSLHFNWQWAIVRTFGASRSILLTKKEFDKKKFLTMTMLVCSASPASPAQTLLLRF